MERAGSARNIAELKKRVELAETNKKKLIAFLQQLKDKWLDRELTYSEYEDILEQKLQGKTLQEWFDFYQDYTKDCQERIKKEENKIIRRKVLITFLSFAFISILLIGIFYIRPTLIGFVVKETQEFTQTLNLQLTESTEYEWGLENPGFLQSLKISGLIEGEGEVKIYLDDLLILDSDKIKEKKQAKPGITGFAIEETESYSEEQEAQTSPFQEPPVSGNITQTQTENITITNTTQPEIPAENITPEVPGNITPITPTKPPAEENITQPPEEEIEITIKEFSDLCEETCNLKNLNLNQSSYTLKIEISNSKLFLEKIKYEIVPFPFPANVTIPENITEPENITLIQGKAEIGKPVKWKARIKAISLEEAKTKLPKEALISSEKEISPENFELEYETPAPQAIEKETAKGKIITISGIEEIHYENVTAYTQLTKETQKERIKLYHLINETKELIEFNASDTNNNGLIDYVEWTIPSLSNQTYELIIEISKAEHLDENKNFISDIYEQVKELDNIWSETIPEQHYVRVTFKQPLDNKRDITLFPRIVSGNPRIIVYEVDKNEKIAEFSSLNPEQYNKIYLTNLIGEQDTFDLKVIGGSIELEHIIDPYARGSATSIYDCVENSASSTCTLSNIQTANIAYENLRTSDPLISRINVSMSNDSLVPAGSTINHVEVCMRAYQDALIGDDTNDACYVDSGTNYTGTYTYTRVSENSKGTCNNLTATTCCQTLCWNITSFITSQADPLSAAKHVLFVWQNYEALDNNVDIYIDWVYANVTYTPPDIDPPALNLTYPLNTTYSVNVSFLNYTVGADATWCMYYNGTSNATISTCGVNLTNMVSSEGSQTWIVFANDSAGNQNTSKVTFVKDTFIPYFYNYTDTNSTLVRQGYANFSVNINATNGTVYLRINNTINFASNISNWFNVTVNMTNNGTYLYNWTAYGNGSINNLNISDNRFYTVNTTNAAVTIYVWNSSFSSGINPLEENYREIQFNVTIWDPDGVDDINTSSVSANITYNVTLTSRANSSCTAISGQSNATAQNFSCTIQMWYWDKIGAWNINVSAKDLTNQTYINNASQNFSYNQLQAIKIFPRNITWANVILGATNQTSNNDPTVVNNTGNYDISGKLAINAIDMHGEARYAEWISVSNFSVGGNTGGTCTGAACIECNETKLVNFTDTTITGIILEPGNLSLGTTANDSLYYCLMKVPRIFNSTLTLSAQTYSTNTSGAWTIKILVIFAFAQLSRKSRRKKKLVKEDKLIKALSLITDELKEEYSLNKKELIEIIIEKLREKYKISRKEISELIEEREKLSIPITIFSRKLGALESLVKYMKENLNLSYHETAEMLNRDDRTIWTAYKKAAEKQKEPIKAEKTEIFLPLSVFRNRELTVLESVIIYLKERKMKYNEIAKLLDRDPRNIWTIYSRAVKKIERKI